MKKFLIIFAAMLACVDFAHAGNVTTYPNVSSVTGSDIFFDWQTGTQQNCTGTQLKTYLMGAGSLSIGGGKTLTDNNTLTFTGTDGSSINFGGGGTVLYSLGVGSSTQAWNAKLDTYAALSPPGTSGYLLSASTSGVLAWVPPVVVVTAAGTNTYTATPSPALTAYNTGLYLIVTFTNANTAGASLNLNSLGAVPIQQSGAALVAGQIPAGARVALIYDGADFQIIGNSPTTFTFSTGLTSSSGLVTVNYGTTAGTALQGSTLGVTVAPLAAPVFTGIFSADSGAVTTDGTGDVTAVSFTGAGSGLTGLSWGNITGTPTTVAGYSISDAVTLTGAQTLTNKSIAASEVNSGTIATARLGSGTASSTTVLYGDQTYKTAPLVHVLSGTLSAGTTTVTVPSGVTPWVQNTNTTSLTNVGPLECSVSGTTATVKSTNSSDTSTFNLFYWQ